jgi:methyl-accepting chemotaxis protein
MALIKTSKMSASAARPQPIAEPVPFAKPMVRAKPPANGGARHSKASERIAAATDQLASGLSEASAAAEELRRAMEQIASGAEEAAGASQEQLSAIKNVVTRLGAARSQSQVSRRRTEAVEVVLIETAVQVTASVRAIEKNAGRQQASVTVIGELERRAQEIREITRTVSRISDQTNLLALNAAIEAARAGDHGRGFAVVAEEVRALAETSEKSAQSVQRLAESIQSQVREVVIAVTMAAERASAEAKAGATVVDSLDAMRGDMKRMAAGSEATLNAAMEAERSATEAQRGAEQVASAAEEQSAAATEAQTAIGQQAQSLDQGQTAAQALATMAEGLQAGRSDSGAAEQIGAMAEELSATVQELSSAATQIMAAAEQINRGSQQQAAATQQTSTALSHIEASAALAQKTASLADERVDTLEAALKSGRAAIEGLVSGVGLSLEKTGSSLDLIISLETVSRRIEKIVDAIALVAVQTSMLAVSGAVEAARAGDSGRGFAVVSSDIRSLAREASDSADSMKDTAQGIIGQLGSVRRDLEQVIGLAEAEVQKNQAIFATLAEVNGEVAALKASNTAILQDAGAILAACAEVAVSARQIATAAEEASAASRQAATASGQQARGAEDLAAAIEEIALLADELKQADA